MSGHHFRACLALELRGFTPAAASPTATVLGAGEGWGQIHPAQRTRARRVRGLLRRSEVFRAGRVQWLPDDEQSARNHSRQRALAKSSSEQIGGSSEARFVMGRGGPRARRCFFAAWPAAAWRCPRPHGEGRAVFRRSRGAGQGGWWRSGFVDTAAPRPGVPYPPTPTASPRGPSPASPPPTAASPYSCRIRSACFAAWQQSWHPRAGARTVRDAHVPQCARVGGNERRGEERSAQGVIQHQRGGDEEHRAALMRRRQRNRQHEQ